MNAKEKQAEFIKFFLKPILKQFGYHISGQTWWKANKEFYYVINLQNYSWNSKDNVDFRFNIGIALRATVKDNVKYRPTHYDMVTYSNEDKFILNKINKSFTTNLGYVINDNTHFIDFCEAISLDFKNQILPSLEKLSNLQEVLEFYGQSTFGVKTCRD